MADARIVTASIGEDLYITSLNNGVHVVLSDEPAEVGGSNKGPTPGDFLRMSLASCTAITLRMYANRKKFDVEKINVEVRSETADGKTIFHRNIFIKGNIDNEQRERMMKIANQCPVHKALTNPIEIQTTVSN